MRYFAIFAVLCLLCVFQVNAQQNPESAVPKPFLPELKYPTADLYVASLNIMDYRGADNTGQTDMAPLIKTLLTKLVRSTAQQAGVGNGGVLFLPEGRYRLDSNIIVPKGVTIRGEWEKPVRGEPIKGTIITTDFGHGEETSEKSLFILEPAAAVKDLSIWYPRQDAGDIVPYPPAIGFGAPRYWGNEYGVAQNVTFVNAYSGAILLYDGGAPNMFGLYGTPLSRGVEIDFIAEVGRVEVVDFSPEYWIGSGLANSPQNPDAFRAWLRSNGTAVILRRIDWTFVSNLTADGYKIGVHLGPSKKESGRPNGQCYRLHFTNCQTALYAEDQSSSAGVMFHDVRVERCDYGVFAPRYAPGSIQLTNWSIDAMQYAIAADVNSSIHIMVNQSEIVSGKIGILGGVLILLDSDVDIPAPQIRIGPEARSIIAGNRFSQPAEIVDNSMFETQFIETPILGLTKIPEFPYQDIFSYRQRPDRAALYVATDAPHGVIANSGNANDNSIDNTDALQAVLNLAASEGGGVVYLPPGKYRILGSISIPEGVELQGAVNVGSVPLGPGSILEAYGGKGDAEATPFITMQRRSGLRGFAIDYPEQKFMELLRGTGDTAVLEPHVYPYAVRVAGPDAYLVNVGFRATYAGIDLFTHRCDNVYIEYPSGHFFTNGIRVGGGVENIHLRNAQFNTIGYAYGDQSKFGIFSNAKVRGTDVAPAYRQNYRDLRFFILEDCRRLFLFNNFHFGSRVGTVVGTEHGGPSGLALGHGIDAAVVALEFNRIGRDGFNLIGSQIVALPQQGFEGGLASRHIKTTPGFTGNATMFSGTYWGGTEFVAELGGGSVHLQLGRLNSSHPRTRLLEANPMERGRLRLTGSSVNAPPDRSPVNESGAKQLEAEYSVIGSGNSLPVEAFGRFESNLPHAPRMLIRDAIDKTGWTATASRGGSPGNMLDGNIETRWGTGGTMQPGDWIEIDMVSPKTFNSIILNQGNSRGDFPGQYEVFISQDGRQWGSAVVSGDGKENFTAIHFPEEQNARYVRIVLTQPRPQSTVWWSVAELDVMHHANESIAYPGTIPSDAVPFSVRPRRAGSAVRPSSQPRTPSSQPARSGRSWVNPNIDVE